MSMGNSRRLQRKLTEQVALSGLEARRGMKRGGAWPSWISFHFFLISIFPTSSPSVGISVFSFYLYLPLSCPPSL